MARLSGLRTASSMPAALPGLPRPAKFALRIQPETNAIPRRSSGQLPFPVRMEPDNLVAHDDRALRGRFLRGPGADGSCRPPAWNTACSRCGAGAHGRGPPRDAIAVWIRSAHLDRVREDRNACSLHDGVLGELLDVIAARLTTKDESRIGCFQAESTNPSAET